MAKILLVDDDCDLARAVGKTLALQSYAVTVANSGTEGWKHLKTDRYDLVILDWDMPDLEGVEVLKLLRSAGDTTPVIMLTGRADVSDKLTGLDSGANDYLTKPFEIEELIARIRACLRAKTAAPPPPKPLGENNEEVLKKADLAGTMLASRLEFLAVIGEGGVAIVFKARHPHLEKLVAVKMLQASELSDETKARFEREAKIVSKLDHPNIVTVHDFGITENKQPYMVMELVEGPNLYDILQEREYLPLEEALPILLSISSGIAYAHDHGILHRDIKPGNIMLKQSGNQLPVPKILDFGLAKLLELNPQKAVTFTQAHQIVGSPPYMSPEQVRGQPLDERSDIYSFGCLMFEVVTGYPPFVGDTPAQTIYKHLEEAPLTFAEARPGATYPPEFEQLIARALEKDPVKRYPTMHELHEDLSKISLKPAEQSIWSRLRKIFP